jgi:hypothetical protein
MNAPTTDRKGRTTVEVDMVTRYRLRNVAAKRDLKMRELLADLAKKAEIETFGAANPTPFDTYQTEEKG